MWIYPSTCNCIINHSQSQKLSEVAAAERVLAALENIKDGVFDLNYLADEYLDGVDRIMGSFEVAKERFEKLKKS